MRNKSGIYKHFNNTCVFLLLNSCGVHGWQQLHLSSVSSYIKKYIQLLHTHHSYTWPWIQQQCTLISLYQRLLLNNISAHLTKRGKLIFNLIVCKYHVGCSFQLIYYFGRISLGKIIMIIFQIIDCLIYTLAWHVSVSALRCSFLKPEIFS